MLLARQKTVYLPYNTKLTIPSYCVYMMKGISAIVSGHLIDTVKNDLPVRTKNTVRSLPGRFIEAVGKSSGAPGRFIEAVGKSSGAPGRFIGAVSRDWQLYLLLLPAVVVVFIFCYLPLYGVQIVFREYKAAFGIYGSKWVGLKNFTDFFSSYYSPRLIVNTLLLNLYYLLWGFPLPIIMAILLNQMPAKRFKKFSQTVIYAPHFISQVVMVGMLFLLLKPDMGLVNRLIGALGADSVNFMLEASWFRSLFVGTEVWQHAGWNSILYIAALTAIDPGLYEAATMDGASKTQKIRYIDIPHLIPIVVMLLILNSGAMLVSNTDKALLMQTPGNIPTSDIIGVYVYRMGIQSGQFSYVASIGLFTNIINFILIVTVNWISRRMSETSLF